MIIDDDHRFAFIHIPKCAGGSVRSVLSRFDTTGNRFGYGVETLPGIGRVDMAHIPLAILCEHFPDEFGKLRSYHSVAIIRNPHERFPSSLTQFLTEVRGAQIKGMTKREMAKEVDDAISALSGYGKNEVLPCHLVHFQSQHSYVFHMGEQILSRVYNIGNLALMLAEAEKWIGSVSSDKTRSSGPHHGEAIVYRSAALAFGVSILNRTIPAGARQHIPASLKNRMRKVLYVRRDKRFQSIFDSSHVRQFVERYYQEDFDLHETVASQAQT